MKDLVAFIQGEIWFFLLGFLMVVVYKILTGKISLRGIMSKKDDTKRHTTIRIQLFIFTVIGAIYYLYQVIDNPKEFPQVSDDLLFLLGGSNMIYLGGKSYSLLFKRR